MATRMGFLSLLLPLPICSCSHHRSTADLLVNFDHPLVQSSDRCKEGLHKTSLWQNLLAGWSKLQNLGGRTSTQPRKRLSLTDSTDGGEAQLRSLTSRMHPFIYHNNPSIEEPSVTG